MLNGEGDRTVFGFRCYPSLYDGLALFIQR